MNHMRISDTKPSSVILSEKSSFKNWKVMNQKSQTSPRCNTKWHWSTENISFDFQTAFDRIIIEFIVIHSLFPNGHIIVYYSLLKN